MRRTKQSSPPSIPVRDALLHVCGAAGSSLVVMALNAMREADADEVCERLYSLCCPILATEPWLTLKSCCTCE